MTKSAQQVQKLLMPGFHDPDNMEPNQDPEPRIPSKDQMVKYIIMQFPSNFPPASPLFHGMELRIKKCESSLLPNEEGSI